MSGDKVIRKVEGLPREKGVTQGLMSHWENFGFYSDQGGNPGKALGRRETVSDLGSKGIPLAACGEGVRSPGR